MLSQVVDRATIGLCAEMLGGMSQIFANTLTYLKTRQQFGVFIGTFQVLKHRAARLFMEIELARSAVMAAARAADAGDPHWVSFVSPAKAHCSDAYILAANEGIQMHGGIGMTDEHDAGFYLKRARVAERRASALCKSQAARFFFVAALVDFFFFAASTIACTARQSRMWEYPPFPSWKATGP